MGDVPDEVYPIEHDVNEFWKIVHKYVNCYIKVYWKTDEDLRNDKYLPLWWSELVSGSIKRKDLCDKLNIDTMTNVVTQLICNGSLWHNFVGSAQEYLKYPDVGGSKIRANQSYNEIQNYVQALTVGVLTGIPMPDLINDWTFVLLQDEHLQQTRNIMCTFQAELLKMSVGVNERNEKRRMKMKFIDPKLMDISIGI